MALKIGGRDIRRGTIEQILLKASEYYTATPVNVPVIVIRGAVRGPVVFLTVAIHGDELIGVEIVRRVMTGYTPQQLRGTLICVPVVNRVGFLTHTRYLPARRNDRRRADPHRRGGGAVTFPAEHGGAWCRRRAQRPRGARDDAGYAARAAFPLHREGVGMGAVREGGYRRHRRAPGGDHLRRG